MIYGNIKETLNLICVQVHRDNTVNSCGAKKIGYEFRTN